MFSLFPLGHLSLTNFKDCFHCKYFTSFLYNQTNEMLTSFLNIYYLGRWRVLAFFAMSEHPFDQDWVLLKNLFYYRTVDRVYKYRIYYLLFHVIDVQ